MILNQDYNNQQSYSGYDDYDDYNDYNDYGQKTNSISYSEISMNIFAVISLIAMYKIYKDIQKTSSFDNHSVSNAHNDFIHKFTQLTYQFSKQVNQKEYTDACEKLANKVEGINNELAKVESDLKNETDAENEDNLKKKASPLIEKLHYHKLIMHHISMLYDKNSTENPFREVGNTISDNNVVSKETMTDYSANNIQKKNILDEQIAKGKPEKQQPVVEENNQGGVQNNTSSLQ